MREHGERYAQMTPAQRAQRAAASKRNQHANDLLGCVYGIDGIVGIALALGGLWLLIAIVKWMWQHS